VAVRGNRGLEEEVVAEGIAQRELVVVRAGLGTERERRIAVDSGALARRRDIAEQEIVRGVFLVDENENDPRSSSVGLPSAGIVYVRSPGTYPQ